MGKNGNDLNKDSFLGRVDKLEEFKVGFEGKEFDAKVLMSIKSSREIEQEIKCIAWKTIREKILWIIIGGAGLIFIDLLMRAIPHILHLIG